ncbi:LysR family transcriptional regulator [Vibrio lamellibrachiae]|uniref:LysR family transcriptional regulator n=1 Tax=Vibrio lamellibrachiae TaxID=2910253 RepID=UPI003D1166EC
MDLSSRLLMLLDVVELGSFAKVADKKNVDRSMISKQIGRLEDELGVRLLNRTTRSLSLTTAGGEVVKQATELRNLLNDTHRLAQNYHSEPRGVLKITSSMMFGRQFVQDAISIFQSRYPEIECELRLDDRVVDIVQEGFDIGFRIGKPKNSSLISRKIARSRLLIVAAPDFIEKHGPIDSLDKLESLPATIYANSGLVLNKFGYYDESGTLQHFQLNAAYKVNDVEMVVKSTLSGNTLAVVAAQMINDEVLEGKLVPVMTELPLEDYGTFYAVYPHRDAPRKTKLFIDVLKAIVGEDKPIWDANIPNFNELYNNYNLSK